MTRYGRPRTFGEEITHLVDALALSQKWKKTQTVAYLAEQTGFVPDTVYKWRKERICPSASTLEVLARIGHSEAQLDRQWGERLLTNARHPDALWLVEQLWGIEDDSTMMHNLPKPPYVEFIGRQRETESLLSLLGHQAKEPLIMVDGMGGVGKTALVLQTAYLCLRNGGTLFHSTLVPTFDALLFASAKQQYLTPDGIWQRSHASLTLRAILREIAFALSIDLTKITPDEHSSHIRYALSRQRTLLIVDNLETIEDRDHVLAFLYDLPPAVKVMITTREQYFCTPIHLGALPATDAVQLIYHEAAKQFVQVTAENVETLLDNTGGVPAAIIYAVGQFAAGRVFNNVMDRLTDHAGEVARFLFQDSILPLRGRPAHQLLMAIAIFPHHPLVDLAFAVAGLDPTSATANEAIVQLQKLSLLRRHNDRLELQPLTREYTLAELSTQVEFELAARHRWVATYIDFVEKFGGEEWPGSTQAYQELVTEWENIAAVIRWCMERPQHDLDRYVVLTRFSQRLRGFTLVASHLDERQHLLSWLSQEAERRSDWRGYVETLSQKAWILTMLGRPEQLVEAKQLLERSWYRHEQISLEEQAYLATHFAAYFIRCGEYAQATAWLDTSQQRSMQAADSLLLARSQAINTLYWRGVLAFHQGEMVQAQTALLEVQQLGEESKQRWIVYDAQNWLAAIAIQTNRFQLAEELLQEGLSIVEDHHDGRRTALYQQRYAHLEQKRNNHTVAQQWMTKARSTFEQLGMWPEMKNASELLRRA